MTKQQIIICPYCGNEPEWVENKEIYGRNYGSSYMMYLCRDCDAYVGCHQNTRKPKGTLANKELRELRMQAHAKIDPLWVGGSMKRKEVYKMLADRLGMKEVHIGESDVELCKKIIALDI